MCRGVRCNGASVRIMWCDTCMTRIIRGGHSRSSVKPFVGIGRPTDPGPAATPHPQLRVHAFPCGRPTAPIQDVLRVLSTTHLMWQWRTQPLHSSGRWWCAAVVPAGRQWRVRTGGRVATLNSCQAGHTDQWRDAAHREQHVPQARATKEACMHLPGAAMAVRDSCLQHHTHAHVTDAAELTHRPRGSTALRM